MTVRKILAQNLRQERLRAQLSQEELADRAEINRNYVGMIERCENAATVDILEKLAVALDIPVVVLLEDRKSSDA